jgi:sialate O-acetylesterase
MKFYPLLKKRNLARLTSQQRLERTRWVIVLFSLAAALTGHARADVKLAEIFGDHMVLQAGAKLPVWGWADPGEKVTVTFGSASGSAVAGGDGTWRVELPAVPPNTAPQSLKMAGHNTLTCQDVLVGDVWVAAGQSNMDFGIGNDERATETIAQANEPQLRLFMVPRQLALQPQRTFSKAVPDHLEGRWQVCSPASLGGNWGWKGFSAVAYYFGREIHRVTKRPIGLIQTAWGGTQAAGWTSISGLEKNLIMAHYVQDHQQRVEHFAQATLDYPRLKAKSDAAFKAWNAEVGIPFQKAMDQWNRDVAQAAAAGQRPPPKPRLTVPKPPGQSPPDGWIYGAGNLFNGMVAPLIPYAIKGGIWYQGENDRGNAFEYFTSFPGLIADWREQWNQGDFPFLFVQLANCNPPQPQRPSEGYSTLLREAQLKTLAVPHTGMAVTIDIGSCLDIHYKDKLDVGLRLALAARRVAYGEKDLVASGPLYTAMTVENGKIRLKFKEIGSGLILRVPPWLKAEAPAEAAANATGLKGFAIAGEDRKWIWAEASIDGDTVVVSGQGLAHPVAVRYDWQDCPPGNLYNKEGLPASPFRTDAWKD